MRGILTKACEQWSERRHSVNSIIESERCCTDCECLAFGVRSGLIVHSVYMRKSEDREGQKMQQTM